MYTFTLTCFPKRTHNEKLVAVGAVCILLGICIGATLEIFFLWGPIQQQFQRIAHRSEDHIDILNDRFVEVGGRIDETYKYLRTGLDELNQTLTAVNRGADARFTKDGRQVWDYITDPPRTPWTLEELGQLGFILAVGVIALVCATATAASTVSHWVSHWIRGGYTSIDPRLTTSRIYQHGDCQLGCYFTLEGHTQESVPCIYVPEADAWLNCTAPFPIRDGTARRDRHNRTISGNGRVEWMWDPWANDWNMVHVMPILVSGLPDEARTELNRDTANALQQSTGPCLDYCKKKLTTSIDIHDIQYGSYTLGYDQDKKAFYRIAIKVKRAQPHERMF